MLGHAASLSSVSSLTLKDSLSNEHKHSVSSQPRCSNKASSQGGVSKTNRRDRRERKKKRQEIKGQKGCRVKNDEGKTGQA